MCSVDVFIKYPEAPALRSAYNEFWIQPTFSLGPVDCVLRRVHCTTFEEMSKKGSNLVCAKGAIGLLHGSAQCTTCTLYMLYTSVYTI